MEISDGNAYTWLLLSENEGNDEDIQKPQGFESSVAISYVGQNSVHLWGEELLVQDQFYGLTYRQF